MTATTEWSALQQRVSGLRSVKAFVVLRPDRRNPNAPPLGVPLQLNLTEALATQFRTRTREHLMGEAQSRLVDYDTGYRPAPGELIGLAASDVPGLGALRDAIIVEGLPVYSGAKEQRARILLYGVVLGTAEKSVVCLQHFSPRFTLKPDRMLLLLHRDDVYDQIVEDGFAFDLAFDLVLSGEFAFALDKSALEGVFKHREALVRSVRAHVGTIAARVPIANVAEFESACASDLRFATKLAAIVARPTFPDLTPVMLAAHAARHGLAIARDGSGAFVFSNAPEERWQLLKLLDDDYLDSQLTSARYEVNSKIAR